MLSYAYKIWFHYMLSDINTVLSIFFKNLVYSINNHYLFTLNHKLCFMNTMVESHKPQSQNQTTLWLSPDTAQLYVEIFWETFFQSRNVNYATSLAPILFSGGQRWEKEGQDFNCYVYKMELSSHTG